MINMLKLTVKQQLICCICPVVSSLPTFILSEKQSTTVFVFKFKIHQLKKTSLLVCKMVPWSCWSYEAVRHLLLVLDVCVVCCAAATWMLYRVVGDRGRVLAGDPLLRVTQLSWYHYHHDHTTWRCPRLTVCKIKNKCCITNCLK